MNEEVPNSYASAVSQLADPANLILVITPELVASRWQRFFTYLIDTVCIYALTIAIFGAIGVLSVYVDFLTIIAVFLEKSSGLVDRLLGYLITVIFYLFVEGFFRITPGKLKAGTRIVKLDGSRISFKDAAIRSLSRLIPFEPLSIFFSKGNP